MEANLRIKSMRIMNFGSFVHVHEFVWDRGPGVWFIGGVNKREPELGPNGAGKSTLITALYWGMTGRTLRSARPGDRIETWGFNEEGTFVEVVFDRDGAEHTILRRRDPNRLLLDGKEVVEDNIQKLLGVTPEVMLYTFILCQHTSLFLDLKPEPQATLFTELLDLNQWLDAADTAGEVIKRSSAEVDRLTREIERMDGTQVELKDRIAGEVAAVATWAASNRAEALETEERLTKHRRDKKAADAVLAKAAKPQELDWSSVNEAQQTASAWRQKCREAQSKAGEQQRKIDHAKAALTALKDTGVCNECGQKLTAKNQKTTELRHNDAIRDATTALAKFNADVKDADKEARLWMETHENGTTIMEERRAKNAKIQPEYDEKRRVVMQLAAYIEVALDQVARLSKLDNPHVEQLASLERRHSDNVKLLGDMQSNLTKAAREHDLAAQWRDIYREIRMSIIEETLDETAATANRDAERLGLLGWQMVFVTERETKKGTVSLGFNVLLYPPDQKAPIDWTSYSGGESNRWQLATAFGLSEVLLARSGVTPNIEVYDEPSRGLSPEGISDLIACLSERATALNRTIYVVDHHAIDRGAFAGVVTVTKTQAGSRITE